MENQCFSGPFHPLKAIFCPVLLFTARDGLCGKVKLAPPPTYLPTYLPTTSLPPRQTFGSCSGPLRGAPRPCGAPRRRRGRRLAPGPRPAPPRPTTDRPAARLPLDPSPAAPSPGRLTAHGALGCSPPPPRVPRRHACPCLDALCASRARVSGTDGAATAPAVAAPPPRRARCRRRRRRRLLAVSPSPRAATHAPCPDARALQRQSARLSQTEQ